MTIHAYAAAALLLWSPHVGSVGQVPGAADAAVRQRASVAPRHVLAQLSALMDEGELSRARTLVEQALRRYPSDAALHNIAGAIDAQQGAYGAAERHFQAAIRADRHLAGAYVNLGRLYQEHAKEDPAAPRKALAVYRELLSVDPANTEALFQAAYLSACAGDWASSRVRLDRLPIDVRSRPQALAVLAVDLAGLADHIRAAEVAREIIRHPGLTEQDLLAVIPALERAKDDVLSELLFAGLDERHLASAGSLRQLGIVNMRLGRLGRAREVLERAFSDGGAPVPLLVDLARVAYKQRDFEGALGYLAHARDLDPNNAEVHFMFGIACVELNLGAEAYDALKKAVALAPGNAYVNYAMGAVAIHRHDPSDALPYFEKYVRLKPDDPRGRFALGAARFYSNDLNAARLDLRQAARSADTAAGAHYFLARIARQENDIETARQEIERALQANPRYADALAEVGWIETRRGEFEAAERSLQQALAIDPDNYAATFNLAALYARTRDPRADEQKTKLEALQAKRAAAAQEFLRIIQVVQ
jgi:tetratricopeptide (TPR) repeat protein